jgi:hypothetical protein
VDIVMTGGGDRRRAERHEQSSERSDPSDRVEQLSSWMMILGTIRLICALGDSLTTLVAMARTGMPTLRMLGQFLQRNPPVIVLGMSWPLVLGLILRRSRDPVFVRAASATFLILSVGGLITLVSGILLKSEIDLLIGSFTVSRYGVLTLQPSSMIRALVGLVQLGLELMTAIMAVCCVRSSVAEYQGQPRGPAGPRKGLHGRLAVYLTIAFLVLGTRHLAWSTYVAFLNESSLFREFVLQADQSRRGVPSSADLVQMPPMRLEMRLANELSSAYNLAVSEHPAEAKDRYLKVIDEIESSKLEGQFSDAMKLTLAQALNNLSWLLSTCEDVRIWRPSESVSYAARAVALAPDQGNYWNTLGVAHYRSANWDQAINALNRSMELRSEGHGDAYDWYFLAMIHAKQGQTVEALDWYQKAATWSHAAGEGDQELYRFQVEAAEQLGVEKPSPPRIARGREYVFPKAPPRGMRRRPTLTIKGLAE